MSRLFDNGVIYECSGVSPPPRRDYYNLLVKVDQVIWRWWKITPRRDMAKLRPGETIDTYEDFLADERLQSEIRRIFGKSTLQYVVNVCQGHPDYITHMPEPILRQIIRYLSLEDIRNLSYTCQLFYQLCDEENLWHELYESMYCDSAPVPQEVQQLGDSLGWKTLFFTSKLKLQMHLRRLRSIRSPPSK